MKKILLLSLITIAFISQSKSQTPDWSTKIAAIIYSKCSSCHHEGGIGPINLMSYADAVTNSYNLQANVTSKKMPPWPADDACSYPMIADRSLSDDDINSINDWVNNGMPEGDISLAPAPPVFNTNSQLTSIDQTIKLPHYTVQLETDEYRTFVIHSGYDVDQYINQIEVVPGNNAVVHHVLFYYDPTSASYDEDMKDTLAGFSTNGANTPTSSCVMIGGWAPGAQAVILPANMAHMVTANSDFVVEVHYAKGNVGAFDSTKINLKFCSVLNPRLVNVDPILFHYWPSINATLFIPANTIKTFYEKSISFLNGGDYSLLGVSPHCHLIGKTWSVYMTSPGNADTTQLLCIPNWDFHWQVGYGFKNLIHWNSSGGYTLRAEATYDNTSNNPNNPNNPPIDISLGESTTDEMMVVFFTYLDYLPGDEDIVLEGNVGVNPLLNQSSSLRLFPNPAVDQLQVSATLPAADFKINVMNTIGVTMKTIAAATKSNSTYTTNIDVSDLAPGIYFVELNSGTEKVVKKFVKQ